MLDVMSEEIKAFQLLIDDYSRVSDGGNRERKGSRRAPTVSRLLSDRGASRESPDPSGTVHTSF